MFAPGIDCVPVMGPKRKPDRQSLKETTLQGYGGLVALNRDDRMAWLRPATPGYAVKSTAKESAALLVLRESLVYKAGGLLNCKTYNGSGDMLRRKVSWIGMVSAACVIGLAVMPPSGRAAQGPDTPERLLEGYLQEVQGSDPAFEGFSAERGRKFYLQKHALMGVGAVSCASCHRKDPREQVRAHKVEILCRACHVINDDEHPVPKEAKLRYIEPFAPHANPERFSDHVRVEKFFKVNCTMVLKRECTPQEKGDLIAWLLTVEGEALYPAGRGTGPIRALEE